MEYIIRQCVMEDLDQLQKISVMTYMETFGRYNTEDNMKAYLSDAFNPVKLEKELKDKDSSFYFLYAEGKLTGYLKLNEGKAQTDVNDDDSIEIERIYLKKEFQGKGLGKILLEKAYMMAKSKMKSYLWLGVWEHNEKALSLYEKNGFYKTGEHVFVMGDDRQLDYLMRKDI